MSGWAGNDFTINPTCPCGKKISSKNITEFTGIITFIMSSEGMPVMCWTCKNVNQSWSAQVENPYLLGYLIRFISIAKIKAFDKIWINGKPQSISKSYFLVPEEVENITLPTVMNIL